MKIKTSELSGVALDWAVAQAIEEEIHYEYVDDERRKMLISKWEDYSRNGDFSQQEEWSPSTNWSQGGPLIERFGVTVMKYDSSCIDEHKANLWTAQLDGENMEQWCADSPSPLSAACRAIVSAKIGHEVDVPEELL